jgi:hypothetical protein
MRADIYTEAGRLSEKKEVRGQPTAETKARACHGSWSRRGALAEQGGAGSSLDRPPLPCQCGSGGVSTVWVI